LTTLVSALQATGLLDALPGKGAITVLPPERRGVRQASRVYLESLTAG